MFHKFCSVTEHWQIDSESEWDFEKYFWKCHEISKQDIFSEIEPDINMDLFSEFITISTRKIKNFWIRLRPPPIFDTERYRMWITKW